MGSNCYICGQKTIFFIWSTARHFPREKIIKDNIDKILVNAGVPVCFRCYEKIKRDL